jgi:GT2 family glycosyltransferase
MDPTELARPSASVIVLNLNGKRYLNGCIESLLSQQLSGGKEIIVVDNGSSDGSVEHVRTQWPQVCVVEADRNLGFAEGNNLGIAQARGHHIVLLNNDTRARPGWLAALVSAADADDSIGAVTSKLVYMRQPDIIQNAGSLLLSDGSAGDRGSDEVDVGQYDSREEVFAACGCAMLVKRAALTDAGLFDPTFFCYYEDTDLSWRMRLRGWRILYEPAASVEHLHSGTSVEWSPFFTFHVDRNRLFMILKNAPAAFVLRSFLGFAWLSVRAVARTVARRRRSIAGASTHGAPRPSAGSRALIHARVLCSLIVRTPEMLRKRAGIRGRRRVSDNEIMRWQYPRQLWDERSA